MKSTKISSIRCFSKQHKLTQPYTIAYRQVDSAHVLYTMISTDDGLHASAHAIDDDHDVVFAPWDGRRVPVTLLGDTSESSPNHNLMDL